MVPDASTPDVIDKLVNEWRAERPETDPDAMHVVGRIIRLGRMYEDEVTRLLQPHGLAYSDFDVLATLRRSASPHEQSPTELQRNVVLTSGAMTACLRRLEAGGFVSRTADPKDRRRLSARLTTSGYDLVEGLIDRRFALAKAATDCLTPSQATQIRLLLHRLLAG